MAGGRVVYITLFLAAVVALVAKSDVDRICGMSRDELMECKPAVATGADVPPAPTKNCCTFLGHANLTCFCQLKKEKPYYFSLLGIDPTRAMGLPTVCDSTKIVPCAAT